MSSKIRISWTDARFKQELIDTCTALGRFPSNTELRKMGRNDLSCQIVKRGGFLRWAEETGFERVRSDSDVGWDGESEVSEILTARHYEVSKRQTMRCSYDLLISGCLRVDVKTAQFATYRNTSQDHDVSGWFYRIGKESSADVFAFFQSDTRDLFFIPWFECPTGNVTISRTGKYQIFKNDYALLDFMIGVRQGEVEKVRAPKLAA